jgi:hypothetical protein
VIKPEKLQYFLSKNSKWNSKFGTKVDHIKRIFIKLDRIFENEVN